MEGDNRHGGYLGAIIGASATDTVRTSESGDAFKTSAAGVCILTLVFLDWLIATTQLLWDSICWCYLFFPVVISTGFYTLYSIHFLYCISSASVPGQFSLPMAYFVYPNSLSYSALWELQLSLKRSQLPHYPCIPSSKKLKCLSSSIYSKPLYKPLIILYNSCSEFICFLLIHKIKLVTALWGWILGWVDSLRREGKR